LVQEVQGTARDTGIARACGAVDLSRSVFYRLKAADTAKTQVNCKIPKACVAGHGLNLENSTALTRTQQERTLSTLNSDRFLDCAPRQVWTTLLDEDVYLCSWRTMYRLLHRNQAVKERRSVRRHPKYVRPELAASGPNQVWTWDITYIKGPIRGQFGANSTIFMW
jgi:putative transposase